MNGSAWTTEDLKSRIKGQEQKRPLHGMFQKIHNFRTTAKTVAWLEKKKKGQNKEKGSVG